MITIVEKLRPFSHRLGTSCLIPNTSFEVVVYPTLVRIFDIRSGIRIFVREEEIPIQGPVKEFTIVQDLEKGVVTVFGKDLLYHINPDLTFSFQKKPVVNASKAEERLFLGMHKQQDWDHIYRRCDFREIFPLWHRLGALLSFEKHNISSGMFSLLEECRQVIELHRPEKILPVFEKLFLAGFRSLMVPRLEDDEYQGILDDEYQGILKEDPILENPLYLLSEGCHLIRSLFVNVKDHHVHILPNVPPEFFAGKFINISLPSLGLLSLEWSKKMLRRMTLQSTYEGKIPFVFSSSIKRCRIRQNEKEKGMVHTVGDSLRLSSNQTYYFDRFEK